MNYDGFDVDLGITKSYGYKNWRLPMIPGIYRQEQTFIEYIYLKLIRYQLRHNQPVSVSFRHTENRSEKRVISDAIITGFTTKDGKSTYDLILIESTDLFPLPPTEPYKIKKLKEVEESELYISSGFGISFID